MLACFFDDDESGVVGLLLSCLATTDQVHLRGAAVAVREAASNLGLTRLAETMQMIEALDAPSFAARAAELYARVRDEVNATHDACVRAGWIMPPAPQAVRTTVT